MLNHTSGLHNAMADVVREDPMLLSDWKECLNCIANSVSESQPGEKQLYHYLSYGWLCGGIIEVNIKFLAVSGLENDTIRYQIFVTNSF